MSKIIKVAVAVGHTKKGVSGSGAVGFLNESDCNREIVPLVVKYINSINGFEAKEFRIDKANSWQFEDCYERSRLANEWGAGVYVEIHLNHFSDPSANGVEVLVLSDNSRAIPYSKRINDNLSKTLGLFDRTYGKGYKVQNLIVLKETNMPALLVECLFCSNKGDSDKYNAKTIAKCIAEGIVGQIIIDKPKKYYIETNYLPSTEWGVEIISVINKYFKDVPTDRLWIKPNDKGQWLITQYYNKAEADMIAERLRIDGLLYRVYEE